MDTALESYTQVMKGCSPLCGKIIQKLKTELKISQYRIANNYGISPESVISSKYLSKRSKLDFVIFDTSGTTLGHMG